MWARLVHARNQESDAIRPLSVVLGVGLRAVADGGYEALERDGAAVGQAGGERLLLHEVGKDAGVGRQAGQGETEVLIDGDYFLLVGGQFFCVALHVDGLVSCELVVLRVESLMEEWTCLYCYENRVCLAH